MSSRSPSCSKTRSCATRQMLDKTQGSELSIIEIPSGERKSVVGFFVEMWDVIRVCIVFYER